MKKNTMRSDLLMKQKRILFWEKFGVLPRMQDLGLVDNHSFMI